MLQRFRDILRRSAGPSDLGSGPFGDDGETEGLIQELRALGEVQPPAGARERTWALLRAELGRQQARGVYGPPRLSSPRHRYGRLALGGAAVMLAAVLGFIGLSGDADQVADNSSTSTVATVRPGTSTSETSVPSSLPADTSTSVRPDTTAMVPPSSATTAATAPGTTASTTAGTEPEPRTTTTRARTTTTSSGPKLTRQQRESSARSLAMSLADKVVLGDMSGAQALVTGRAGSGLAQMVASMREPYGYRVVTVSTENPAGTRVLMEFWDRRDDGQGNLIEVKPRFYFDVQIGEDGAVITGIYKAPSP
ncbi:MAG: hypothetical protein Kow00122_10960 [Thermoleophilia bacterium]